MRCGVTASVENGLHYIVKRRARSRADGRLDESAESENLLSAGFGVPKIGAQLRQ
jgi:hypothetical protein